MLEQPQSGEMLSGIYTLVLITNLFSECIADAIGFTVSSIDISDI